MTNATRFAPASSVKRAPAYPSGLKGTFAWMAKRNPDLHARIVAVMRNPHLAGLGITGDSGEVAVSVASETAPKPSVIDRLQQMLLAAGQTYLTAQQMKAQKKILDMQLARAQAGLPPLDIDMSSYGLPGPQVGVGLSPNTQKFLLWGAVGLAAVYLVPKFLKR